MLAKEKSPLEETGATSPVGSRKKQKVSSPQKETKEAPQSEYNIHLRTEEVEKIFKKLGFEGQNIISTSKGENYIGDIFTKEILEIEINNVLSKADYHQNLILFKVNSISKDFDPILEKNNHYVALYFEKIGDHLQLTYLDPTGHPISDAMASIIKNSNPLLKDKTISNSNISLQYTELEAPTAVDGEQFHIMGGNDRDCGVLLPLAVKLFMEGKNNIKLTAQLSRDLGQVLRRLVMQDLNWHDIEQNIQAFIAPEPQNVEKKLELQDGETLITRTNLAVENLQLGKIIRFNTTSLFNEEAWNSIKKMFDYARNHIACTNFAKMYVDLGVTISDLSLSEKLKIIVLLYKTNIKFNLINDLDKAVTPIFKDGLCYYDYENNSIKLLDANIDDDLMGSISIFVSDGKDDTIINIEENVIHPFSIKLSDYLYSPQLKILVLDKDLVKCPPSSEFHEKIHLLDNLLPGNGLNLSLEGFKSAVVSLNLESRDPKLILSNLLSKIFVYNNSQEEGAALSTEYTRMINSRDDGDTFGAAEILAFTLQYAAMGKLNTDFEYQESHILLSIINSFNESIQKIEELSDLKALCQSVSGRLQKNIKKIDKDYNNSFGDPDLLSESDSEDKPSSSVEDPQTMQLQFNNDEEKSEGI